MISAGGLREPEGKTREYKRDLSSPDGLIKTVVAFANSAGGQIIVGVNDDHSVAGISDPLAEEERVANLIADRISPLLVPGIDIVSLDDKYLLVIDVPLSTRRPHYLKRRGKELGTYLRLGSTNRQADAAMVAELERTASGIAFEDLPELRATLDDLDLEVLSSIRGRPTSVADLIPLGLATRDGGRIVPTYAGLLVASPHPENFISSAWVQCGRLRGPDGVDIFDQREIHGFLLQAVEEVIGFITKHAYKSAEFGAAQRKDVYSVPVAALREIVTNAIVHASYSERGTPIRIGFYDDRIVVESPGGLMAGLTVETMRGISRLRNPSMARILRDAGLMEQWGSGLNRVYRELAEAGLPEPRIEEVVDRVRVTIFIGDHARTSIGGEQVSKSSEQVSKSSEQVSKSSEQVEIILRIADEGSVSRKEILHAIGLTDAYRNYQRHILPLIDSGLLARTIPDKPNSRSQRYVTTDKGRRARVGGD